MRTFSLEATYSGRTFVILGRINDASGKVEEHFKEYQMQGESQDTFVERARKRAITEIARLDARDAEHAALQDKLAQLQGKVNAAVPKVD